MALHILLEGDFSHYGVTHYSLVRGCSLSLPHHGWEDISQMEVEYILMYHSKVGHCDI